MHQIAVRGASLSHRTGLRSRCGSWLAGESARIHISMTDELATAVDSAVKRRSRPKLWDSGGPWTAKCQSCLPFQLYMEVDTPVYLAT